MRSARFGVNNKIEKMEIILVTLAVRYSLLFGFWQKTESLLLFSSLLHLRRDEKQKANATWVFLSRRRVELEGISQILIYF